MIVVSVLVLAREVDILSEKMIVRPSRAKPYVDVVIDAKMTEIAETVLVITNRR